MKLNYTPGREGTWLLVVARNAAILYRADSPALAVSLLEALGGTAATGIDPVQAALDVLTGRGLASTPAFALASWNEGVRVALLARGDIVLLAETPSGTARLDGRMVTTWHETNAEDASAIRFGEPGPAESALSIESGAVWASAAWLAGTPVEPASTAEPVEASAASTPVAQPTPVAEPVEAPADLPENTITELTETDAGASTLADLFGTHPDLAEQESEDYGHLFEETIVRSIEDAAVRPQEPAEDEPDEPAVDGAIDGDHDGMTVMSGDLAALRSRRPASDSDSAPRVPASRALFLELSTGGREPIGAEPVLVGRSPSVRKVSSGAVPRLVTIPGDQDISRNHARFDLEGDTVVVTDLHSRNGTSIILPGKSPQVLRQGEPTAVIVGTIVDLGGGVTLTVREGE